MQRASFRLLRIFSVALLSLSMFAGCGVPDLPGPQGDEEEEIPEWKAAADNKVGADAFRRVDKCGSYRFDPEGKVYCNGTELVGQWVKTDEKTFGEEHPNHYDIWKWNFGDAYGPGGFLSAALTFRAEGREALESGKLYGSIYFADLNGGDGDLDSEIIVRDYFEKTQNNDVSGAVEMSHFGPDNDGRQGSAEEEDGDREYYYDARGAFPRLGEDGEKIWVALDISDEEDKLLTRCLWEYTFRITEPESEAEDNKNKSPGGDDPQYYYAVDHPGHWLMTDIRFIGGDNEHTGDQEADVRAQRYGVEGETMVYTFTGEEGSYHRIRIPDIRPAAFVYAGNTLYAWINNYSFREPESAPGRVVCSLAFGDVEYDTGKYGIKVTPRQYFTGGLPSMTRKAFNCPPDPEKENGACSFRDDLQASKTELSCALPEGSGTGEKIYLVYGVMDSFAGDVRMYNVYEYTYFEGPDREWIYNPPMPD